MVQCSIAGVGWHMIPLGESVISSFRQNIRYNGGIMLDDNQISDFYKNYRENLSRQYEVAKQNLGQQRKNAQTSIMSGANKSGMLYSNFPQREKIKYDVNTYQPSQTKLFTSYQTGLDQLRNNILNYQNSIRDIQDAIAHFNSLN